MRRAFILTLDALFAISLLAAFLVLFSTDLKAPRDPYWLSQLGESFMTSLDKGGLFYDIFYQSQDETFADMQYYMSALPDNINANITIDIYDLDGTPFRHRYSVQTMKKGGSDADDAPPDHLTHVKRVFSDFNTMEYGIAQMVLWYD